MNLSKLLKAAGSHLGRLFFPPRCIGCRRVVAHNRSVCPACEKKLPFVGKDLCPVCGREKEFCHLHHRVDFVRCAAPFYYMDEVKNGILALKKTGQRRLACFFGAAMAQAVKDRFAGVDFDLAVCVPGSPQKRKELGFDHAELLAECLAEELGLRFESRGLVKLFDNKPQHSLHRAERSGNVLGVYEADESLVKEKTVLLVDDIETTGATLHECAKMLRLRGAEEVYAVTACLSLSEKDRQAVRRRRQG